MRSLAFDQATNSGWAFGTGEQGERYQFGKFAAPKRDSQGERLMLFRRSVLVLAERLQPEIIGFEEPYWPRPEAPKDPTKPAKEKPKFDRMGRPLVKRERPPANMTTLKFLQRIAGVLEETCAELGVPYETYPPSTWRHTALGFSRAPYDAEDGFLKKAMVEKAKAWGYEVGSNDEADAIGILYHCLHGSQAAARGQGDLMSLIMGGL